MNHYMIVFDRSRGEIVELREFADSALALRARFAAEANHRGNPDIEVVALGAKSRDALRRTHARYFEDVASLTRRTMDAVRTARHQHAV